MKSLAHQCPDAKQATQEDFEQALEDLKYLLKAEAAGVTKQDHFPADQLASMPKRFAQSYWVASKYSLCCAAGGDSRILFSSSEETSRAMVVLAHNDNTMDRLTGMMNHWSGLRPAHTWQGISNRVGENREESVIRI